MSNVTLERPATTEQASDHLVDRLNAFLPFELSRVDVGALRLWLWSRIAAFMLVFVSGWMLAADATAKDPTPFSARWSQWDAEHYLTIAQWGYDGAPGVGQKVPLEAFFPGLPIVMRVLHLSTGIPLVWVGLLISFVAGGVAAVALARIAASEFSDSELADRVAERAVLVFLTAPAAVFLAAVYTEALFLAFALPAWLAARRGKWVHAGALAAVATSIRVTGLFLALALIVEFFCARDGRRRWRALPALGLPFVPLVFYGAFLQRRTGDWLYWQTAQREGWGRRFAAPWEGFWYSIRIPFDASHRTDFAWMFMLDIFFVLAGSAVTVALLRKQRWAEATFMGLQILAVTANPYWQAIDRFALTWWPMWIALAVWSLRRQAVLTTWLVLAAPLMVVLAASYSTGRWAG